MSQWIKGTHGGTYGGNAVSCAAAAATIKVLREEKLIENSAALGNNLLARLKNLQVDFPRIGDVRGLGLMVATEFTHQGDPDTETAKAVWRHCLDNNLLLLTCGPYGNVIRWIPPLMIDETHLEEGLQIFQAALDRYAA